MRSKLTLSLLALLLPLCFSTFALSALAAELAAPTPPIGWNSWNHFGHRVTDQTIRDRVMTEGSLEVWMKPLADGSKAIAIFNRWTMPLRLDVPLAKFGFCNAPVNLHDVWEHQDLPAARGTYHAEVPPHGVVMLRATQR